MKARDVDVYDSAMFTAIAEEADETAARVDISQRESDRLAARAGRLRVLAEFVERHVNELAECEHGALRGRCTADLCDQENFEADDLINRAQTVADLADNMGLAPAVESLSFVDRDFRELVALAWIGARVSAVTQPSATDRAPGNG